MRMMKSGGKPTFLTWETSYLKGRAQAGMTFNQVFRTQLDSSRGEEGGLAPALWSLLTGLA